MSSGTMEISQNKKKSSGKVGKAIVPALFISFEVDVHTGKVGSSLPFEH